MRREIIALWNKLIDFDLENRIFYTLILTAFTPVAIVLSIISGGAGHGNYFFAHLFYPYSMLLSGLYFGEIGPIPILLSLVQFTFYGIILDVGKKYRPIILFLLSIIHLVAFFYSFLFLENFN